LYIIVDLVMGDTRKLFHDCSSSSCIFYVRVRWFFR